MNYAMCHFVYGIPNLRGLQVGVQLLPHLGTESLEIRRVFM